MNFWAAFGGCVIDHAAEVVTLLDAKLDQFYASLPFAFLRSFECQSSVVSEVVSFAGTAVRELVSFNIWVRFSDQTHGSCTTLAPTVWWREVQPSEFLQALQGFAVPDGEDKGTKWKTYATWQVDIIQNVNKKSQLYLGWSCDLPAYVELWGECRNLFLGQGITHHRGPSVARLQGVQAQGEIS